MEETNMKEWKQGELPPIGEECEVHHNGEWEPCEIIAHIEQPIGTIAVFSYGREPGHGISGVDCLIPRYFRTDLGCEAFSMIETTAHDAYVTKAEADQYYCDREGECLMNNQHEHASSTEWTGPEQGFPPPGTRCMVMDDGEWHETTIVGMDTDGFCVYETPWSDYDNYDSDSDPQAFYPLMLTDEDKAVEEMRRTVFDNTDKISVDDVCRSLHRAGYRITFD